MTNIAITESAAKRNVISFRFKKMLINILKSIVDIVEQISTYNRLIYISCQCKLFMFHVSNIEANYI